MLFNILGFFSLTVFIFLKRERELSSSFGGESSIVKPNYLPLAIVRSLFPDKFERLSVSIILALWRAPPEPPSIRLSFSLLPLALVSILSEPIFVLRWVKAPLVNSYSWLCVKGPLDDFLIEEAIDTYLTGGCGVVSRFSSTLSEIGCL